MDKQEAIAKLQKRIDQIPELKVQSSSSPEFAKWQRDTQVAIQRIFGEDTRHIKDFNNIDYSPWVIYSGMSDYEWKKKFRDGLDNASAILESFIDEIQEFWPESASPKSRGALSTLGNFCIRFHRVARQLEKRRNNRTPFQIDDEYDVQDLFYALLQLEFEDIQPEAWTPSYAGGSARMDFLLKSEQAVVEIKKTRKGLGAKELGDQLLIDIQRYQQHPDCKTLVCFAYDPDGLVVNPRGLEKDLSGERDGLLVLVIIAPRF